MNGINSKKSQITPFKRISPKTLKSGHQFQSVNPSKRVMQAQLTCIQLWLTISTTILKTKGTTTWTIIQSNWDRTLHLLFNWIPSKMTQELP